MTSQEISAAIPKLGSPAVADGRRLLAQPPTIVALGIRPPDLDRHAAGQNREEAAGFARRDAGARRPNGKGLE